MKVTVLLVGIISVALFLHSPTSALGRCADCSSGSLCDSLRDRRENLTCAEATEIAVVHLEALVRSGDNYKIVQPVPEDSTRNWVAGFFCGDLGTCETDLGMLASAILKANPEIPRIRRDLIDFARDTKADPALRTIAAEVAAAADIEDVEWLIDLLDPRHGLMFQLLIPAIQEIEADEDAMSRLLPKLVLVAQSGRNFHDRTSAMILLLRNRNLIDSEVLIPLLLIGRETCSSTTDRVRRVALEEAGPLEGELERLLAGMCHFEGKLSVPQEEEEQQDTPVEVKLSDSQE